MSVVGNNRVGIPIVLLHDAEGAVVSVETKSGVLIRGLLFEAEDMMNLYLKNAVVQNPDGTKRKVDQLYLRGKEICFISLPDMLKHAPMFERIKHWRKHAGAPREAKGPAIGQAAAILRKAQERRRGGFGGRGPGGPPHQGGGGRGGYGGRGPGGPPGGGYGGGGGRGYGGGGGGRGYGPPPGGAHYGPPR